MSSVNSANSNLLYELESLRPDVFLSVAELPQHSVFDTEYSALVNVELFLRHSVSKVPSMCSVDS